MIINAKSLETIQSVFSAHFKKGFGGAKSCWDRVAMRVPSSGASTTYAWMGQMPRIREWVGDRELASLQSFGFTLQNKDFETTVVVGRNDIMDDTFGVYGALMQEMGHDASLHPDQLVFKLLLDGFVTACYDNQNFFDTSHPTFDARGVATTASNMQAGGGSAWYLLDTTRPVKPLIYQERMPYVFVAKDNPSDDDVFYRKQYVYGCDGRSNAGFGLWQMAFASKAALNSANYRSAKAAMTSLRGDSGSLLGVRPNLCVVPPSLEYDAKNLFKKAQLAGGESNVDFEDIEVLVVDWLAQ